MGVAYANLGEGNFSVTLSKLILSDCKVFCEEGDHPTKRLIYIKYDFLLPRTMGYEERKTMATERGTMNVSYVLYIVLLKSAQCESIYNSTFYIFKPFKHATDQIIK